jgi:hypothetical protein
MKIAALRSYLKQPREAIRAALSPTDKKSSTSVDFEVVVDLPQRPLFPINETEKIRVSCSPDDGFPEVLLLREDFPQVPHLMLKTALYPKQICLYQHPWEEEKSNWAPGPFVDRIRHWLAGSANGTLHLPDQTLEPLLLPSPQKLILPPQEDPEEKICWIKRYYINLVSTSEREAYLVCSDQKPEGSNLRLLPFIFVKGPPSEHGIIHHQPATLADLETLIKGTGGSLVDAICSEIGALTTELSESKDQKLILVLQLPKMRTSDGKVEWREFQAFFLDTIIGDLLRVDTEHEKQRGIFVPQSHERIRDPEFLRKVGLTPLSVRWRLTRNAAASMNGHRACDIKITAIGLGTIGSQVINNLWRGGFGKWTLVDSDTFDPHNAARHLLPSCFVGTKKVHAVAEYMHTVLEMEEPPVPIVASYPSSNHQPLTTALKEAEVVLDFSASVAVERALSIDLRSTSRRLSVFLNQRGDELVILSEPQNRAIALSWLEAEYLQAIADEDRFSGHFDATHQVAHRYGNACRELSSVIQQDVVAALSGIAANRIRKCIDQNDAFVGVFRFDQESGSVQANEIPLSTPLKASLEDWQILIHPEILPKLARLRNGKLPKETGGVLLGIVDRTQKTMAITGALPAPANSHEWPTSFIRGTSGLSEAVKTISQKTLGNIVYLGEWHSHPPGRSPEPSPRDWKAINLRKPHMEADGLPTLMLIIGHNDEVMIAAKPLGKNFKVQVGLSS